MNFPFCSIINKTVLLECGVHALEIPLLLMLNFEDSRLIEHFSNFQDLFER